MAATLSSPAKFDDLPNEIVEKVISYLSYENISSLRIVSSSCLPVYSVSCCFICEKMIEEEVPDFMFILFTG